MLKSSFYITYAFLMTTGTITFIEALRTTDPHVRNIMNLETCISIVAAFFYARFMADLYEDAPENDEEQPDGDLTEEQHASIIRTRYIDWSITTPIMLLVLLMVLVRNDATTTIPFAKYAVILVLNYAMLGLGFLGETGHIPLLASNAAGFLSFAGMFTYIYRNFVRAQFDDKLVFWLFASVWSLYGVSQLLHPMSRNLAYNGLDLVAKCFVGIFLWAYFTKVFRI